MINVFKAYRQGSGEVKVLDGIDLVVEPGAVVAIVGPSGSGKTTLLNVAGCLLPPDEGRVEIGGRTIAPDSRSLVRARRTAVSHVFQRFGLLPGLTALENLLVADVVARRKPSRERAVQLLDRVGLSDRLSHPPARLSGGEMQRVAIARALMTEPTLIVADEPTGSLDSATSSDIADLLFEQARGGDCAVLMATHDQDVARRANVRWHLSDGCLS